jgi:hypothetical protein
MIAADANKSNSISAIDIVTLRKLILGIIDEIPENTSWRFVNADYDFTDPANPLAEQFEESYKIAPFMTTMPDVNFIGIKVGDVNNTVVANLNNVVTRTSPGTITLQTEDIRFSAGDVVEVAVQAAEKMSLEGYQFTLNFDQTRVRFESYAAGTVAVDADNFNVRQASNGMLTTSWSDVTPTKLEQGNTLFVLRFRGLANGTVSEIMNISSDATEAEAYNANGDVLDIGLNFINPGVSAPVVAEFELLENRPNPFTEATIVSFITPRASKATLTIYDVTGKVVDEMVIDAHVGRNDVEVRNLSATGVLYCQVSTDEFSATRKMIRIE